MAGRNTRVQTINKAAARRFFFIQNIFIQNVVKRHSYSPITVSASKRHEHKPQSKRLHNAGESESEKRLHNVTRGTQSRAAKR